MSGIERFETQSGQPLAPWYPLTLERRTRWRASAERSAAQRFPTMRCQPVRQLRTLRHDPRRVDVYQEAFLAELVLVLNWVYVSAGQRGYGSSERRHRDGGDHDIRGNPD